MSFDLALTNSDISINADGTIATVTDSKKLRQDVLKVILTPTGSVRFHPWYGSVLNDNIIGEIPADNALFQYISNAISESLGTLQKLQRAQSTYQETSPAEHIARITNIAVQRAIDDPRQVNVIVTIVSKDITVVEESFTIS